MDGKRLWKASEMLVLTTASWEVLAFLLSVG